MAVSAARFTFMFLGAVQNVAQIVDRAAIHQQAGGLDGGDLNLFVQIVQQKGDAGAGAWIADLLNARPAIRRSPRCPWSAAPAPGPEAPARPRRMPTARAALARASMLAPPRAIWPSARITSGRTWM